MGEIKIKDKRSKIKKMVGPAIDFHGHLGPYLILGLFIGALGLHLLKAKRHFGIQALVRGAVKTPKSCLIDGIQLSAGCTFGKGNIQKVGANRIEVIFRNSETKKKIKIRLKDDLICELNGLKGHKDSEEFAMQLFNESWEDLFELNS